MTDACLWEGEFYFEYHRGTYTSMARNKRSNRKAELGLMDLELLSVLAQAQAAYPAEELDRMWKKSRSTSSMIFCLDLRSMKYMR